MCVLMTALLPITSHTFALFGFISVSLFHIPPWFVFVLLSAEITDTNVQHVTGL